MSNGNFDDIIGGLGSEGLPSAMRNHMGDAAYEAMVDTNRATAEAQRQATENARRVSDAQAGNYEAHTFYRHSLGFLILVVAFAIALASIVGTIFMLGHL